MSIYKTFYKAPAPINIDKKNAFIIGGGLAGLATAVFLIDDTYMPGKNITIFEKTQSFGGCCESHSNKFGYVCAGEREFEPYMECLWYLCSKIPSIENSTKSILDETVESNKDSAIHSECRFLKNEPCIYEKIHDFKMSFKLQMKLLDYITTPEEELQDLSIEDYFGKNSEFFNSSLWWCFHTMLAFKPYHSALEAQRYLNRFALDNRMEYLEGILHTKRNENDSIIVPITKWLSEKGVNFKYDYSVYDLDIDKSCNTIHGIKAKDKVTIKVRSEDFVFLTNGSIITNYEFGDNTNIAATNRDTKDMGLFNIWKNLAKKNAKFGNPEKFLNDIDKTKWTSYFLTVKDYPEFFDRLEKMTGSKSGTGGAITFKDSGWEISLVIYDRNYYSNQKKQNRDVLWGDALFGERLGNYIKKPISECTGNEIILELLYHFDMLDIKDSVLKHSYISTCMMPYITSQFMPRKITDRPKVVPDGCTNLAFIGQYVEVPSDVVFTIEMSVRTALEAVYTLTKLDKDILEVYPSRYDLRYSLERFKKINNIKGNITINNLPKINLIKLFFCRKKIIKTLFKKINQIPAYYIMYPGKDQSVATKYSVLNPQYPKCKGKKD